MKKALLLLSIGALLLSSCGVDSEESSYTGKDSFILSFDVLQSHRFLKAGLSFSSEPYTEGPTEEGYHFSNISGLLLTDAKNVEDFLNENKNDLTMAVSFTSNKTDSNGLYYNYALTYTVYLNNSTNSEQTIEYDIILENYKHRGNYEAMNVLRVLCQTQQINNIKTLNNRYYGLKHTAITDYKDQLEPISNMERQYDDEGFVKLVPTFSSEGNDGYCVPFVDYDPETNPALIRRQTLTLPANSWTRFTCVWYVEGNDPDAASEFVGVTTIKSELLFYV